MLGVGPLHNGFALAEPPLAIVTENELYAQQARTAARARNGATRLRRRACCATSRRSSAGDPVVHEQHGIGRYPGLVDARPRRRRRPSS